MFGARRLAHGRYARVAAAAEIPAGAVLGRVEEGIYGLNGRFRRFQNVFNVGGSAGCAQHIAHYIRFLLVKSAEGYFVVQIAPLGIHALLHCDIPVTTQHVPVTQQVTGTVRDLLPTMKDSVLKNGILVGKVLDLSGIAGIFESNFARKRNSAWF